MSDLMQQARELLAAEYESRAMPGSAANIRAGAFFPSTHEAAALSAIAAALRAAPKGFVMVPAVPTPEMDAHGRHALRKNGVDYVDDSDALVCWSAMLAARPQEE